MGVSQEAADPAEQAHQDEAEDSGTSFSMDESSAEDKQLRNEWFPLRPSAVGEDDEDTIQVTYATNTAGHSSNTDRLQSIPHAWSDDDAKQSPPERSQPDGRDGPDLKRTPWIANTYMGTQQTAAPPVQSQDAGSNSAASKDSGSDVSVLSQPQSDHNITPLDIITRSVPPAKRGVSLISELRQRHAPQLNSDSDTESPVSKLLGPNFRAVQQVLDRLKQDRLTDSVSDEGDEATSEGRSLAEESIKSMSSAGTPATTTGSEWTSGRPASETKPRSSTDAVKSFETLSSRLLPSQSEGYTGGRQSLNETSRRFSESNIANATKAWDTRRVSSWTSAKVPYDRCETSPVDAVPKLTAPAAKKSSQDLMRFSSAASSAMNVRLAGGEYGPPSHHHLLDEGSEHALPPPLLPTTYRYLPEQSSRSSIESSLHSSRIAWGEHTTSAPTVTESSHTTSNEALPSSKLASRERLHDLTPRSSIGSSIATSRAESRLPPSSSRELSSHAPTEEMPTVIPAGNFVFPGQTSSVLVDGKRTTPNAAGAAAAFSSMLERSDDPNRAGRDEEESLQHGSSSHDSRDSGRSASSDDTDDLLTYEPVLEGDRQYLRMQKPAKRSGAKQKQSEDSGSKMPAVLSGDRDNAAGMLGKEQSPSTVQGEEGSHGTPVDMDDSHIKSLHWSLGAGTISPISITNLGQMDSQQEKSSTPLAPASERSSVLETGTLQEQSLEEDVPSVQTEDHDVAALKQSESRSTTDFSSSDEMYKPVLYRDVSANKENRPDERVFQTSSYGIYDIRRSSGPGSTNRRRKALGLEPNPARETASQDGAGLVYISGSSTPSSVPDGRGRPLGGMENSTDRTAGYRDAQPMLEYYEGRLRRNEELTRPETKGYQPEREANALKRRQARETLGKRDVHDQYRDKYLLREERRSDRSKGHETRAVSSKVSPASYSTPEQQIEPLYNTSDRSRQLPGQYADTTDPDGTRRSASSGKSKIRYTDDILAPSSQQSRLEMTSGSRKHVDGRTRHRSRNGRDSHGGKASRLDANISKLSSLISKSIDESISSSSQTSVIPAARWPSAKSRKHKMTSSSESSDVSEFFNYAFMDPRLRSSIKHKIRLRELLKSVKARDMSPIVRARDSTSPESTSCVSSNEGGERERERERVEREPSPAVQQPHPAQFQEELEKPVSTSRPLAFDPKCTCTCSQRAVTPTATPVKTRRREERGDGREFGIPRKRDVGVNFPTPAVTRSPSPSSDGTLRGQFEDASTQTEELASGRKVIRKIDIEPVKSQRKAVTTPLRNADERGVISQSPLKKSDYIYSVDQREAQHKLKERLIASQNSPDHGLKTTSDRTSRAQVPAWFHPMAPSKPQIEQRTVTEVKTPSKGRTSDELRVDVFDSMVNSSSSLQKLSLQEAFLYAKSQFVRRSQDRVARIEQAAREKEKRKMIAEAAAEENRIQALKAKSPPVSPKVNTRVKSAG